MKKMIIAMMMFVCCIANASEYKYYKKATIEKCVEKLNELNKIFDIYSYKIVPAYLYRNRISYNVERYNLIIEVGKKGECNEGE